MSSVVLGVAKAAAGFLLKMLAAMAGEVFIKWAFFYVAEIIVKSTATPHDDAFLAKAKEAYEEYEKKNVAN